LAVAESRRRLGFYPVILLFLDCHREFMKVGGALPSRRYRVLPRSQELGQEGFGWNDHGGLADLARPGDQGHLTVSREVVLQDSGVKARAFVHRTIFAHVVK